MYNSVHVDLTSQGGEQTTKPTTTKQKGYAGNMNKRQTVK